MRKYIGIISVMSDEKLNILILGNFPPPYGGVPEHIENLLSQFDRLGHSCTVLSGGRSGTTNRGRHTIIKPKISEKFFLFFCSIFRPYFIWLFYVYILRLRDLRSFIRSLVYVEKARRIFAENDFSVVSFYNLYNYGVIAEILAKHSDVRLVGNIFGEIYSKRRMIDNKSIFNRVLVRCDLLLSCSKHCANSVELLGFKGFVEPTLYGVNRPKKIIAKFEHSRLRILMVGRHQQEMGIHEYITIHKLADRSGIECDFMLIGQSGPLSKQLQVYQEKFQNFKVKSDLPRLELEQAYGDADVIIVPTLGDRTCSSLACMDGMMNGCVCIGHDIGGIPELIIDGETGFLVQVADAQRVLEILERLWKNRKASSAMGLRALDYAKENFDQFKNHGYIAERIMKNDT